MHKLTPAQLPFPFSLQQSRFNGFYADLHADGSVAALYHYKNGTCVREARFAEDYLSGWEMSIVPFTFNDIGYMSGWQDFDGSPNPMDQKNYLDETTPEMQQRESVYQELVNWAKDVLHYFEQAEKGFPPAPPACGFCGKKQDAVKRLIAGPSVHICNECVALCNDICSMEDSEIVAEPLA